MKILIVTHQYFPSHVGGTEVLVKGFAGFSMEQSVDVAIMTARETPLPSLSQGIRRTQHEGVPVYEVHIGNNGIGNGMEAEYQHPMAAAFMESVLADFEPDVVLFFHSMKHSAAIIDVVHKKGLPSILVVADYWFLCPNHTLMRWDGRVCAGPEHALDCVRCVHRLHGYFAGPWQDLPEQEMWEELRAKGRLERLPTRTHHEIEALERRPAYLRSALSKIGKIVYLTRFAQSSFESMGMDYGNGSLHPHGIESIDGRAWQPDSSGPPQLLFIGGLAPFKGVRILADALAMVPDLDIELRVHCPEQDEPESLKAWILGDGRMEPRLKVLGRFPPDQLPAILGKASALAEPSLWPSNGPLILKQALALGVPVLASDIGSLKEMVRHGENGLLLPPGDVSAWAAAIERVARGQVPGRPTPQPDIRAWHQSIFELCADAMTGKFS